MPVTPTYPGVYIEEIPSGARSIASVATSICAFVGPTKQGPVNEPTTVFSFGEFDRRFGGLSLASPLSFSVRDFFQNGGGQAIIVRVVHDGNDAEGAADSDTTAAASASWQIDDAASEPEEYFTLEAANPGVWANDMIIWLVVPGQPASAPDDFDQSHVNEQSAAADFAGAQIHL